MNARRESGFTLIELVMVLMVLAIGIPALINLGTNCVRGMHQGAYVTTATSLAQEKLETIVGDEALASRGFAYITSANYPAEATITGFPGYSRSVTIAPDTVYNAVTFRNVSVTVTAPDATPVTLFTWVIN
jgi:prepilin-type N-terminal cleavage/methylation domain-containing protein